VIRMLLVPAVMHLLGDKNWRLPAWLDRALPELHIEGHPEHYQPTTPGNTEQPNAACTTTRQCLATRTRPGCGCVSAASPGGEYALLPWR
jgi:hypothetical protein